MGRTGVKRENENYVRNEEEEKLEGKKEVT